MNATLPLTLVIGDKNLSSWSLRAWLALRATGAEFREVLIKLDQADTRTEIARWSPSYRVPVLVDGDLVVWDSLAIAEYLAEVFPNARLWPSERTARAQARSISCEMHSGFSDLRREFPMNIHARIAKTPSEATARDISRVQQIIQTTRALHAHDGEFLFGAWSLADCMYAPVMTRFRTYGVPLESSVQRYADAVLTHPHMVQWSEKAG